MASFSTCWPLENRVLKTRFKAHIYQNSTSQKRNQSQKEKKKKEKRRRRSRASGSREPRCATQVRDLFLSLSDLTISLSLIWSPSLWSDSLSDLIRSGKVRLCLRLGRFLKFFWIINRVFKTRFSSSPHVENNATSSVIRPWKSSPKDSIYGSKSSLLDSNC